MRLENILGIHPKIINETTPLSLAVFDDSVLMIGLAIALTPNRPHDLFMICS